VTKRSPLKKDTFDDFFRLLPARMDSERSWTVARAELDAKNLDLKAVNPNRKAEADARSPFELIEEIERQSGAV
jgi:hypothetical protein